MTVYVDTEYKCHVANDGTMRAVDIDFFDGKCTEFIEGYRCVPDGETWTRSDGMTFAGLMLAPWDGYAKIEAAQKEYEAQELERLRAELADAKSALATLGVTE